MRCPPVLHHISMRTGYMDPNLSRSLHALNITLCRWDRTKRYLWEICTADITTIRAGTYCCTRVCRSLESTTILAFLFVHFTPGKLAVCHALPFWNEGISGEISMFWLFCSTCPMQTYGPKCPVGRMMPANSLIFDKWFSSWDIARKKH